MGARLCREQQVIDVFDSNTYSVVNVIDITLLVMPMPASLGMSACMRAMQRMHACMCACVQLGMQRAVATPAVTPICCQ